MQPMSDEAYQLAREARCDIRTARKVLRDGVERVRGFALRESVRASAAKLGIALPSASRKSEHAA